MTTVNDWGKVLYKKWSQLNELSVGIIKFENCRTSIFGDLRS